MNWLKKKLFRSNKAIFLDRDGTINKLGNDMNFDAQTSDKHSYIKTADEFVFTEGVREALSLVNSLDYKLIVITQQSGIGKGIYSEVDLAEIHQKMDDGLKNYGIWLDGIYYCPHTKKDNCNCRKPKTGMIEKAVEEHYIDLENSYLIGDATRDIQMGKNAGCKTILVKTGEAGKDKEYRVRANYTANNLQEAIERIIKNETHKS